MVKYSPCICTVRGPSKHVDLLAGNTQDNGMMYTFCVCIEPEVRKPDPTNSIRGGDEDLTAAVSWKMCRLSAALSPLRLATRLNVFQSVRYDTLTCVCVGQVCGPGVCVSCMTRIIIHSCSSVVWCSSIISDDTQRTCVHTLSTGKFDSNMQRAAVKQSITWLYLCAQVQAHKRSGHHSCQGHLKLTSS